MSSNSLKVVENPNLPTNLQSISLHSWALNQRVIIEKIITPDIKSELDFILVSACLIFLYRVNNYHSVGVQISYFSANDSECKFFPLLINFRPDMSFKEAINLVKETMIDLQNNKKDSHSNSFKIKIELRDSFKVNSLDANHDVIFIIERDTANILVKRRSNLLGIEEFDSKASERIKMLLAFGLENPTTFLNKFSLVTKVEKKKILKEWNNTYAPFPYAKTIPDLIEKHGIQNPKKVALIFDKEKMTYGKLNQVSNQLANYLVDKGLKPGKFVAIFLDRSIEMIIAILAILKSGAVYVPIDIKYPSNRINYIIRNSNCLMTISQRKILEKKSEIQQINFLNLIEIDSNEKIIEKYPAKFLKPNINSSNLAYMIYTSGSTGQPKGVQVSHRNVLNYANWFSKKFELKEASTIDFSSSIGFDLSVACTLVPLMVNATIAICDEATKLDSLRYFNHLNNNHVSHIECTPDYFSHLLVFPEEVKKLQRLKWIMLGGDALVKKDVEKWLHLRPDHNLVNEYGPTECTVAITSHLITKINMHKYGNTVPIGTPAFNTQAYILDKYHNLCPVGVPGELYIAGESVAIGYLCPEETVKSFLPNLFTKQKTSKLYKTGDLVRWLSDGNIEFLGRVDGQVKIRGFRIEPAEIENSLLENNNILQCKVLSKISATGEKYLVAYLVLANQNNLVIDELRKYLRKSLPDYMVPSKFRVLEKFPLNSSGKIDIKELDQIQDSLPKENISPKKADNVTEALLKIWSSVLDIETVDPNDNFFDLGGHSLSAMKMLNEISNTFSIRLKTQILFKNPTITKLAKAIRALQKILTIQENSEQIIYPQIICLRSIRKKLPIFLLPPVGGTVFIYRDLVKYLGNQFSVYALQDPGIENPNVNFKSLPEMALAYLRVVQQVQPHGPYFLAGSSFGATLAVELARQLDILGEQVAFVGLLDGWANHSNKLSDKKFFQDFMREKVKGLEPSYGKSLLSMQFSRERLLFRYDIPQLLNSVVLFKARELWPIFLEVNSATNGWEKYSNTPLTVHEVPGDHESMFFEPHVKILGTKMKNLLEKVK